MPAVKNPPRHDRLSVRLTEDHERRLEELARMNGLQKGVTASLALTLGVQVLEKMRQGGIDAVVEDALAKHDELIAEGKAAPVRRRGRRPPRQGVKSEATP